MTVGYQNNADNICHKIPDTGPLSSVIDLSKEFVSVYKSNIEFNRDSLQ